MNFFQAQDQARKQSRLLVALFVLAVCVLIFITNICVALFVLYSNPEYGLSGHVDPSFAANNVLDWFEKLASLLGWKKIIWTTLLVSGFIFMAMGFKWLSLRQGGRVVAESLGGSIIQPSSKAILEKRLLNVVEEIALASGTPVPQVYVLNNELGINAFAAGLSSEDAVIGITRGALLSFDREQLQGVIAHEFSHILNGDMRLNMKLVAVLHGMMMISESGIFFMKMATSNRRSKRGFGSSSISTGSISMFGNNASHNRRGNGIGGLFFVFGLCLWLIGLLGQLFGALIKAAVSRQREFLADASAVQFTRNPDGIADALSIIGGASYQSKLEHHSAHELGHLFFSNANALEKAKSIFYPAHWMVFATHPPLTERIKRIQPKWAGRFIKQDINLDDLNTYASPDPAYPSYDDIQAKGVLAGTSSLAGGENIVSETYVASVPQNIKQESYHYVEFETSENANHTADMFSNNDINEYTDKSDNINGVGNLQLFDELKLLAHQPYEASLMIFSLLISDDLNVKKSQIDEICKASPKIAVQGIKIVESIKSKLRLLSSRQVLDLIELALPSLKLMSLKQFQSHKILFSKLIQADGKVHIFEWLLFQLIKQNLDRHFGLSRPLRPKYKNMQSLSALFEMVLSRVVHYGFEDKLEANIDEQDKRLAFIRACDVSGAKGLKFLKLEDCDGKVFSQAVHHLSLAYPLLKPRIIKSLLTAIHFDEEITDQERYVITAIAAVMDCPLVGLDQEIQVS
jgi:Zn-dependent protease with chaperone function